MPVSLHKLPVVVAEFLVCTDCHLTHHNGETGDEQTPDREPWGLWEDGSLIAYASNGEDDDHGFSWRTCEGCGSTLGGDRFPYVAFDL